LCGRDVSARGPEGSTGGDPKRRVRVRRDAAVAARERSGGPIVARREREGVDRSASRDGAATVRRVEVDATVRFGSVCFFLKTTDDG